MLSESNKKATEALAKQLNIPIEFIDFERDDVDHTVDLGGLFQVFITHDETRLVGDKHPLIYIVTRTDVIPGVRYTRNGDGWPDDVDVTELATFHNYRFALADAASRYAELMTQVLFDSEAEQQDLAEMEQLAREAEEHFARAGEDYSETGVEEQF